MKILCAYSSIEFSCDHFPGFLSARDSSSTSSRLSSCHPVFHLPQKKLISYLGKWASGELTSTDSYLLFLSILRSTDLVDFRVPAIRTPETDAIIAQNMESLCKVVSRLNTVQNLEATFPHYVISQETRSLANVQYWIENWDDAYKDFKAGKLKDVQGRDEWKKLAFREAALQRLIKNPHRSIASYASQIAEWAAIAGDFPVWLTTNPFPPFNQISCAEYWKILIVKCAHEESLFLAKREDLQDLLDHCEEKISAGTLYSNALFKILRHAMERQKNFLGLVDFSSYSPKTSYTFLESDTSVESANIRAMVDAAPETAPRPENFKTRFEYMKAKLRWGMAQKFAKSAAADLENPFSDSSEDSSADSGDA